MTNAALSAFTRARASFGGQTDGADKENQPFRPVKRGVSLGGEHMQALAAGLKRSVSPDETDARKRARRSLVPGRSILRKSLSGPLAFQEDTTMNMGTADLTESLEATDTNTRKSLSRRVSFAPTAHMREFSKADHEDASSDADQSPPKAIAPAPSNPPARRSSLARFEDAMEDEEQSMEMANASVTAAFDVQGYGTGATSGNDLLEETQPDFGDDSTMDLASTDVTAAFAGSAAIQARPSLAPSALASSLRQHGALSDPLAQQDAQRPASSSSSSGSEIAASLLNPHIEYNVPLGAPGTAPPSGGSDLATSEDTQIQGEDEDATMEMSLDGGTTGLIVTDGLTSRRLSVSGAVRRASVAPGHAALAMLDAEEEEDEEDDTVVEDETGPVASTSTASGLSAAPRISNTGLRGMPPSSLAAPSPQVLSRRSMSSPSPRRALQPKSPARTVPPPPQPTFAPAYMAAKAEEEETLAIGAAESRSASLSDFLEAVDVQFMESMFANPKRKSMGASLGADQTANTTLVTRVTLRDQIVAAAVTLPALDTYQGMTRELRASLQEAHTFLETVEDGIANGDIPSLFIEYQAATRSQQELMQAHLKTSKNLYRNEVRSEWYEYRIQCFARQGGVIEGLQDNLKHLEEDRIAVHKTNTDLANVLPKLQEREQALQIDLERERGRQAELDGCDQEHLGSLREAVAEQAAQLEEQTGEQHEVEQELARLEAKLAEVDERKRAATAAIERAKATAEGVKFSTVAEVQRLRADIGALEGMQGWQLLELSAQEVKMIYRTDLGIIARLSPLGATIVEIDLTPGSQFRHDEVTGRVLRYYVDRIREAITSAAAPVRPVALLRTLANQWSVVLRLVREIRLLQHHYPITLSAVTKKSRGDIPALRIAARLLCPAIRASFDVRFELMGEEIFGGNPEAAIEAVGCSIEPRFGDIDREELAYIVRERVASSGRAALLEAAQDAEAKYSISVQ